MNITIEKFLQLVHIDSPSGHEEKMSTYLQSWLKNHKFIMKIDKVGNVYAANNLSGSPLLLCAHMDTVEPGRNIKPIIKNGVIKSSGNTILGADNKAALAAILTAIETAGLNRNLELLFTVKEETGGGIEHFPFSWLKSKQGIIFDKSNPPGGIVLSSPFIYNFHVVLSGKASHAGTPQNGINAFVPAFNALSKIPVGQLDKDKTTVNIGVIKGGTGINTIPDQIHISGEVRSYNSILFHKHLKAIETFFKQESKKSGVACNFSLNGYCPGYAFSETDLFIKQIAVMYSGLGLKTQYYPRSGISDANILNMNGIQTVNLTDGAKYPHTKDEQIAVKDLEMLSQIIVSCINKL